MSRIGLRWTMFASALPALILLLGAVRTGTEVARVSGKLTMKYSQQHALPAGDAAEPVLFANEAKGSNSNTGRIDYMNGAGVTIIETADLTQGNGQHQGYVTFAKGGETSVNRYNGRVTTTLPGDKQPITTFEGTWTKIGGTGRFEGVKGEGRYKGRMLSPTEYAVEWNRELNLKGKTASR